MNGIDAAARRGQAWWRGLIFLLLLGGLGIPIAGLWWIALGPMNLSPAQARARMHSGPARLVAVDPEVQASLPGLELWPLREILEVRSRSQVPPRFRDGDLILICPGGIRGALGARHLGRLGMEVHNVQGGLQAWVCQTQGPDSQISPRISPLAEQAAAVLGFFGLKAVYSLVAIALVVLLWRERAPDLRALWWSLVCFFVGEAFCAWNVLGFGDQNLLLEHLHSAGMVLSLACATFAVLEGLDARLVHVNDASRCAALGMCRICIKHADVPCGMRRVFLLSLPLLILAAALPLFAPIRTTAYTTHILGVLHGYRHPVIHQVYELRLLPLAAIFLFGACLAALLLEGRRGAVAMAGPGMDGAKLLLSAAMGAMAFSYFRLLLGAAFAENQVWFAVWEEASELMALAMAGGVLILFQPALLPSLSLPSTPEGCP